jgi:hypothetical protein
MLSRLVKNIPSPVMGESIKKRVIRLKKKQDDMPAPAAAQEGKKPVDYFAIARKNKFINQKKESACDVHSFCSLLDKPLTQSQNIVLGHCIEHLVADIVLSNPAWVSIKLPNEKGKKETDHLYMNAEKKVIIYGEQKNNINLDTEKSKSTAEKLPVITAELRTKYPDYTVECHILAARYLRNKEEIAEKLIRSKYSGTSVLGLNDFLERFDLAAIVDYAEYKKLISCIVDLKF